MTESSGEARQEGAVRADTAQDVPERDESDRADPTPESPAPDQPQPPAPEPPASLTFRISRVTLLVIFVLAVCMTPVAWAAPWALSIYLIPLALIVWVLRTRTIVTTDTIAARMVRTTRVPWSEVRSFRLDQRRWLRAVLDEAGAGRGREVLLPAVRVRDLPRLAAMSGGRLPDLTGTAESGTPESGTSESGPRAAGDESGD